MKHCDTCDNPATYDVHVPQLLPTNYYFELCEECKDDAITHFTGSTVYPRVSFCLQPGILAPADKIALNIAYGRPRLAVQHLASYKQLEASPIYASSLLTVADAEELERLGVPSPISGDLNIYPVYADTDSLRQAYRGGCTYTAGERRK